jgi:hypothetical protein
MQYGSAKKVGTTLTSTALINSTLTAAPATGYRSVIFVDILKGSPNFTFNIFCRDNNSTATTDITRAEFLTQMQQATPALTTHTLSGTQTQAVDEATDGFFDSVNVYWSQTGTPMELSDIAVARLS